MRYEGIIFHSWKFSSYNLFIQEHCRLITFVNTSKSFKPPSSFLFESVECFIFVFFPFYIKFFRILLSWLIIACGTVVIGDRWTILEIAKHLKTKTFPSIVKLKRFQFLRYGFENSLYVLVFYCRRNVHQIFSVSFVRLRHFMPQSATFTPFSVLIPAISHFVVSGLSPETRENLWKIFKVLKESNIISINSIKELVVENVQAFNIFVRFNYTKYSF